MKRANNLLEPVADLDNLRLAFWKARKGKSYAQEVLAYQKNLDTNLLGLRDQILTVKVQVGQYRYFKVYDPKERQICASAFGEQVLHHALMNVCHGYFERVQIGQSFASRPGKGVHAALHLAQQFTRQYRYFLKLDVRKFFDSIHHAVLKTQLDRMFKDQQLLLIFGQIIDSYCVLPDRGVPIGNLSSQYFANHYLTGLDHFIKEQLRIKAYVRYMDDMVLWHNERSVLKECQQAITNFVEQSLQCALKPMLMNFTSAGLPFVGHVLRPYDTRLSLRSRRRFVQKIRYIDQKYHSGEWSEAHCQRHALPLIAFTEHANAKAFRKQIIFS
ncbi:RNA-directed DNA polymerase [Haliscomenobacter sp.]|uniref:RNA-directed DNA polymerase n=1 Tax=Haliscomenobacter sp. TaxID=2717303 RepID=UPI0035935865